LAILGQKTFDRFENTFPIQKKILPLFVTKGQRVNRVIEKSHNQKSKQKQENRTRLGLQQEISTHMYLTCENSQIAGQKYTSIWKRVKYSISINFPQVEIF
jgi:hypothetical protein